MRVVELLLDNNELLVDRVVNGVEKRLEPFSKVLLVLPVRVELSVLFVAVADAAAAELLDFDDKRELLVDNNEDDSKVFFGSVIVICLSG